MEKHELKQIGDLMREAVGVLKKDVKRGFDAGSKERKQLSKEVRELKTDLEGIKILMVENFTETDHKIDQVVEGMRSFAKMHDLIDGRIAEMEKRLGVVERELQITPE